MKTRPTSLGRFWNPTTKRPERLLHSSAAMLCFDYFRHPNHREIVSHPWFLSKARLSATILSLWCQYGGFCSGKWLKKDTYKANSYLNRARVLANRINNGHNRKPFLRCYESADIFVRTLYVHSRNSTDFLACENCFKNLQYLGTERVNWQLTNKLNFNWQLTFNLYHG